MKRLLVTGGPVHAKLDDVKIITNRFKGGLIAELVNLFFKKYPDDVSIIYLCSKGSIIPKSNLKLRIVYHDGFWDYWKKVNEMSTNMDGVILGAAVSNLIPLQPFKGKFPSHNYKPGDIIPIDFTIAPRVIDEVKKINPRTHLFGFKLLSNVERKELVKAAYGVLLESKATAIFANDTRDLTFKIAVTKDRGQHDMTNEGIVDFVWKCLLDEYYSTIVTDDKVECSESTHEIFDNLYDVYKFDFDKTEEGYVFGTIAVRDDKGFLTTGRGKNELNDKVFVTEVNHDARIVRSVHKKPSLNSPLLSYIFNTNPNVKAIVHIHDHYENLHVCWDYAIPGTVEDSIRNVDKSFVINQHGSFLLLDEKLNVIK